LKVKIVKPLLFAIALLSPGVLAQEGQKELDTPYVPTPQVVVDRMLDLAQVKAGETVIDLGSGDGRIMIEAASRYGAQGFGVEIDPLLVKRSNENARRAGVADRVKFLQQDLFKTDCTRLFILGIMQDKLRGTHQFEKSLLKISSVRLLIISSSFSASPCCND